MERYCEGNAAIWIFWHARTHHIGVFVALIILGCGVHNAYASEKPTLVAAASSLRFAMDELLDTFERESGRSVTVSFGSSGNIARQILQGAPFDVFLSADERTIAKVADAGLTVDSGTLYAIGRLVLFAPVASPLTVDAKMAGMRQKISDGTLKRFAIANPVHAPYGRAAREALRHNGLWDKIQTMIVLGENISQAAQFALSGSVDGGLLSYSLAKSSAYEGKGEYIIVPAAHHAPLRHRMALLERAGKAAREFYTFMTSPKAREILMRHGFSLPGQE